MPADPQARPVRWPPDRLRAPFAPRQTPRPAPSAGVFDPPYRCVLVNAAWVSHLAGVVDVLTEADAWAGADPARAAAIQQVEAFLRALTLGNCAMGITGIRVTGCTLEGGVRRLRDLDRSRRPHVMRCARPAGSGRAGRRERGAARLRGLDPVAAGRRRPDLGQPLPGPAGRRAGRTGRGRRGGGAAGVGVHRGRDAALRRDLDPVAARGRRRVAEPGGPGRSPGRSRRGRRVGGAAGVGVHRGRDAALRRNLDPVAARGRRRVAEPGQSGRLQGDPGEDGADGAPGPPGAAGADGASAELRVYEYTDPEGPQYGERWIQWRQDDDSPTWTDLVSLAALTGPQGPPGLDGVDGLPGAPGAPGECIPYPGDATQGGDVDQEWCGAATYLTDFLDGLLRDVLARIAAGSSVAAFLQDLLAATVVAIPVVAAIKASWDAIAMKYALIDAEADSTFWGQVKCALYAAQPTGNAFSATTLEAWRTQILSLPNAPNAAPEVAGMLGWLTLGEWQRKAWIGSLAPSALCAAECPGEDVPEVCVVKTLAWATAPIGVTYVGDNYWDITLVQDQVSGCTLLRRRRRCVRRHEWPWLQG
ncbi:MAG: collagen-like protein [Anaerolineae bacterium]|nr:collagen-like protein [Anaerolineae bacterium]